jgi:hypothetical protein
MNLSDLFGNANSINKVGAIPPATTLVRTLNNAFTVVTNQECILRYATQFSAGAYWRVREAGSTDPSNLGLLGSEDTGGLTNGGRINDLTGGGGIYFASGFEIHCFNNYTWIGYDLL